MLWVLGASMFSKKETIYLESICPVGYSPINAIRTSENHFKLVGALQVDSVGAFKKGDIVRCTWRYFGPGFDGGIFATSLAKDSLPMFSVGDRVLVSEHAGWEKSFSGSVESAPIPTKTMLGVADLYRVKFDEPQRDRSLEDEYVIAEIPNVYLQSV